jgi:hypothetical protein
MRTPVAQHCEHCGRIGSRDLVRIRVVPITTAPDVGAIEICPSCRTQPSRTWRLRWEPIDVT